MEATRRVSEILDVVPFQESRQLGIAEHTGNSKLGCTLSSGPRSLPLCSPSPGNKHYGADIGRVDSVEDWVWNRRVSAVESNGSAAGKAVIFLSGNPGAGKT